MTPTLQELTLTLIAPNNNPILLTPTFLQGSGIIPNDWQLARQPHLTPQHAQIAYSSRSRSASSTNSINITAKPNSIAFTESFKPAETNSVPTLKIPDIACNYIQTQPHLNYQAITLAPRTFITFPEAGDEAACNYITNLFAPAPWQTLGTTPVKANLNFTFTFENRQLHLNIAEVKLQQDGKPPQNAILFSGNFSDKIAASSAGEKFEQLKARINNWQADWQTYQKTLNTFIQQ
ncbi:hypothetical protein IQ249_15105 [Lusitaniella coriacea LEGE 07157]|uniref:Uncharacterized protein n=1 Tax=Lusitaniella coriacea LEGE 07157 TaxID=945747 RepID=A0A8J7IU23_9CYAN|nr:hypothetical protein [Lusitaniella coriacea]MBE9117227.1 hypothetical protein [Lusitaniella coriacea LEGE 07157]